METINYPKLWDHIKKEFKLGLDSIHGPEHWLAVEKNALEIAEDSDADKDVVRLFAVLHDCMRENETNDPRHGERAAEHLKYLERIFFNLPPEKLRLLHDACFRHNQEEISSEPTIGTCFDADRLELTRVGIIPDPQLMSTIKGKELARKFCF